MGKAADDAVHRIEAHNDGWYNGGMGGDGEATDSLNALADLNSTEFPEALKKLDPGVTSMLVMASRHQGLDKQDKYRQIVDALGSGDPTDVVNAKKKKEDEADTPKFADGAGFDTFNDEEKHAQHVDLYVPKGASAALISLIEDTEFTFRWDFDTLSQGHPKDAPDFSNVLDGEQVTTASGWSKIRSAHDALKAQLDRRQTDYTKDHKDVTGTTYDSKITGSKIFKKLTGIMDDLNDDLKREITGTTHTGNQITESSGGPPTSEIQVPVYEKDTVKTSDGYGKFFLTPEAEQRYYVSSIDSHVDEWNTAYAEATKEFQKQAADVDHKNADDHHASPGNPSSSDNPAPPGAPTTPVAPVTPSTQDAPAQPVTPPNQDMSQLFDDVIPSSTDTTTPPDGGSDDTSLPDGGSDDTSLPDDGSDDSSLQDGGDGGDSSSGDFGSQEAALQNGSGTGSGTGTTANTGSTAPPATPATDPMSSMASLAPMMMTMNAMSQMGNANRPQPADSPGYDNGDPRGDQYGDPNSAAPVTDPGAPAPAPGVTAPSTTPPPVTAPGAKVDYPLPDNSSIQVSPTVAEALHRQTENTAMDAEAAYKGTAGANIPDTQPWAPVEDPAALQTGDTVEWENNGAKHYGLIVRNQSGMHILDNGELVPFDPNNPALTTKYGEFTGHYFHPTGLDNTANGDPGSTALPKPTTSQAQPPGPPPVTPPKEI